MNAAEDPTGEDQRGNQIPLATVPTVALRFANVISGGQTTGTGAANVNVTEYQPFNDRPGHCEGCNLRDRPGEDGPSALQLTWNDITGEWLCAACRHGYSEWVTRIFPDEKTRWEHRPIYMRRFQ